MQGSQAEYSVDPIISAVVQFSLNLGRNAVEDGH